MMHIYFERFCKKLKIRFLFYAEMISKLRYKIILSSFADDAYLFREILQERLKIRFLFYAKVSGDRSPLAKRS